MGHLLAQGGGPESHLIVSQFHSHSSSQMRSLFVRCQVAQGGPEPILKVNQFCNNLIVFRELCMHNISAILAEIIKLQSQSCHKM